MHGIESVIRHEEDSFGISEETQNAVEDMLEDVDCGKQSTDGPAIKDRLRRDGVDESDAATIMELCQLQSRFGPAIEKVMNGKGSVFSHVGGTRPNEQNWFGSLHYMELVDCTEGSRNKMYSVFAPVVPRVGETLSPQHGSRMRVVGVNYDVIDQGEHQGTLQHCLVPYVLLEAIDDDEA